LYFELKYFSSYKKKIFLIPRMLGYSVLMLLCKTRLSMTLGYLKKMYKNTLGEMGLGTIALCTLGPNILAPGKKFEKNAQDVRIQCP